MLSGQHSLLRLLIHALLKDGTLFTSLVRTSDPELGSGFRTSPKDYLGGLELHTRASLDESRTWHHCRSITEEEAYLDLDQVIGSLESFDQKPTSHPKPVILGVRAREHMTDVLERLSLHIREETERRDSMHLCKQFQMSGGKLQSFYRRTRFFQDLCFSCITRSLLLSSFLFTVQLRSSMRMDFPIIISNLMSFPALLFPKICHV
jgi:hypothetical protein